MTTKTLGQRIKEARIGAGHAVGTAFAELIGVKAHTLWRYENDKIRPSSDVLYKIAGACGVSMESFLEIPKAKKVRSGKAA